MITNITSIKTIKELLNQNNLKPLKRFGQNFLISNNVINKVIASANLKPSDTVLEVGPGMGALTLEIAKKVKQVIVIEKDKGLVEILRSQNIKNVKIINADILKYQYTDKKYKVISNLPYNIATAVIMQFLEAKNPPELMIMMLQKEVAQRMCASPPNMSRLSVFTQFYSIPKIISHVSKKNYYPQPKVDSAILKIIPNNNLPKIDKKLFAKIVKAGFANPRKQLINNLSKDLNLTKSQAEQWLKQNKIAPKQRAETLTVSNWITLTKTYPQQS